MRPKKITLSLFFLLILFVFGFFPIRAQAVYTVPYAEDILDYKIPCRSDLLANRTFERGMPINLDRSQPFIIPLNAGQATYVGFDLRWGKSIEDWQNEALAFAQSRDQNLISRVRITQNNTLIFKITQKSAPFLGLSPAGWLMITVKTNSGLRPTHRILVFHRLPYEFYGFKTPPDLLNELTFGEQIAIAPPLPAYDLNRNGRGGTLAEAIKLLQNANSPTVLRIQQRRNSPDHELNTSSWDYLDLLQGQFASLKPSLTAQPGGGLILNLWEVLEPQLGSEAIPPLSQFLRRTFNKQLWG